MGATRRRSGRSWARNQRLFQVVAPDDWDESSHCIFPLPLTAHYAGYSLPQYSPWDLDLDFSVHLGGASLGYLAAGYKCKFYTTSHLLLGPYMGWAATAIFDRYVRRRHQSKFKASSACIRRWFFSFTALWREWLVSYQHCHRVLSGKGNRRQSVNHSSPAQVVSETMNSFTVPSPPSDVNHLRPCTCRWAAKNSMKRTSPQHTSSNFSAMPHFGKPACLSRWTTKCNSTEKPPKKG